MGIYVAYNVTYILTSCQYEAEMVDLLRLRSVAITEFARRPHHNRWPPTFTLPAAWRDELVRDAQAMRFVTTDPDELARRFSAFIAEIEGAAQSASA